MPSKIIGASENLEINEEDEQFTSSSDGEDGDIDVVTDNWVKANCNKTENPFSNSIPGKF